MFGCRIGEIEREDSREKQAGGNELLGDSKASRGSALPIPPFSPAGAGEKDGARGQLV